MESITKQILENNNIYTDKYLKDIINLTKSIVLYNSKEANLYNELIQTNYPSHSIDLSNKSTWRYYKHISGKYHTLDTPVKTVSLDNGELIELTENSLRYHTKTREELLKFDLSYAELVDKYPEQELYIKVTIATSKNDKIQDILKLENFKIVAYNKDLIENNESDLIFLLQNYIDNYKITKLIHYYSLSDNLFIASQYHILYNFIVTAILAIRLKNAKTYKAHSYHILNYFSSHHNLDLYYSSLTKKQALFLYRNLLYLDNHSGRDSIFKLLIDKIFTERDMTITSYTYHQTNELKSDNFINYEFRQKRLNDKDLVYSLEKYDLNDIKQKETLLLNGNINEYKYHKDKIDFKLKNSLDNFLLTKDLETSIIDNTDEVRYKLIPTIIDYWAYMLKTNQMNFLVSIQDPLSNKEFSLSTKDLFKLFVVSLYKINNINLTEFPSYTIERVYKPVLPTRNQLLNMFYRRRFYNTEQIDHILNSIPKYTQAITSFQFYSFIMDIYRFNIGMWLYISNLNDRDDDGQFEGLLQNVHMTDTYIFNNETPYEFLTRIGLTDLFSYNVNTLTQLNSNILNQLFDDRLSFLSKFKTTQKELIEVFKKFNSYTIQIISKYIPDISMLINKTPHYTTTKDSHTFLEFVSVREKTDLYYKTKDLENIYYKDYDKDYYNNYSFTEMFNYLLTAHSVLDIDEILVFNLSDYTIDSEQVVNNTYNVIIDTDYVANIEDNQRWRFTFIDAFGIESLTKITVKYDINFNNKLVNDVEDNWISEHPLTDDMLFRAVNLG